MPPMIATILAPQRLVKGTVEVLSYAMDFSQLLASGESITSITSVTSNRTGTTSDLVITGPTIQGKQVQFKVSGGQTQLVYELVVIVVTSFGDTRAGRGRLVIGE